MREQLGGTEVQVQLGGHSSEKSGDEALNMKSRAPVLKALEGGSSDGESCVKSYILGKTGSFYFFKERKRLSPAMKAMKTGTSKDSNTKREWMLL